jgi:hypothetical protein
MANSRVANALPSLFPAVVTSTSPLMVLGWGADTPVPAISNSAYTPVVGNTVAVQKYRGQLYIHGEDPS